MSAVVIAAPESVSAGSTFPVEVELRNGSLDELDLEQCPVWIAAMGESSENSNVEGRLPCDEIESLGGGERIRLRLDMPATEFAITGEGGVYATLGWRLRGNYVEDATASIPIPMDDR